MSDEQSNAALAPDGGGESLLVVDDDPFIARLLEIELKAATRSASRATASRRSRRRRNVLRSSCWPT
jgi:hypothetical protein